MDFPSCESIINASQRISPFVHRTPVMTSMNIDKTLSMRLFFKCENFQKIGAFKYRGATNAIQQLTSKQLQHGVATHSSGNHAQALALAASIKKVKSFIVMPINASKIKKDAVIGYGGTIIECGSTLEARETTLAQVLKKEKTHFIHPYNDYKIIEGQATAAKEFIEDVPNLDYLIAPVGGGGLLSGCALATKYFSPKTKTVGAEPIGAKDAFLSLKAGKIIPSINPKTMADGLLTSLGSKTFPIILKYVDQIFTAKETTIVNAMQLIWQRMKIIIEPSAAVPLAVVMENINVFKNKKIGIILSGGNVDFNNLPFDQN